MQFFSFHLSTIVVLIRFPAVMSRSPAALFGIKNRRFTFIQLLAWWNCWIHIHVIYDYQPIHTNIIHVLIVSRTNVLFVFVTPNPFSKMAGFCLKPLGEIKPSLLRIQLAYIHDQYIVLKVIFASIVGKIFYMVLYLIMKAVYFYNSFANNKYKSLFCEKCSHKMASKLEQNECRCMLYTCKYSHMSILS